MCWNSHHQALTRDPFIVSDTTTNLNYTFCLIFAPFISPLSTNPHLYSKRCFHVSALQTPNSSNMLCICLRGADIIWKCHCAGAGPFSGSVVRGCIQLNTTSKGPVFLCFILFYHKACAEEACREDQPFPPSCRMMHLPNSAFWELKPRKPC